MTIKNH